MSAVPRGGRGMRLLNDRLSRHTSLAGMRAPTTRLCVLLLTFAVCCDWSVVLGRTGCRRGSSTPCGRPPARPPPPTTAYVRRALPGHEAAGRWRASNRVLVAACLTVAPTGNGPLDSALAKLSHLCIYYDIYRAPRTIMGLVDVSLQHIHQTMPGSGFHHTA